MQWLNALIMTRSNFINVYKYVEDLRESADFDQTAIAKVSEKLTSMEELMNTSIPPDGIFSQNNLRYRWISKKARRLGRGRCNILRINWITEYDKETSINTEHVSSILRKDLGIKIDL